MTWRLVPFLLLLLLLLLPALLSPAWTKPQAPLTMLVDRSADLPFAAFEGDHVLAGIHRDLAQAIAARLGRPVHVLAVPRRRIGPMLREGQGSWSCALLPEWLDEPVAWTQAFLPHAGVVVTRSGNPKPKRLADLAGRPIGVIKGYTYPELERALGADFVREEAHNARALLHMLERGRMQHASLNQQYLEYQLRLGRIELSLHPYLITGAYETRCAVARHAGVSAQELDQVITTLRADGSLARILQRYR